MQKRFVWVICVVVFNAPQVLQADQTRTWPERLEAGLHLGVDFATIGGSELNDTGIDYSYKAGFTSGILCGAHLTRVFAAQVEVIYASKGYRADTGAPSSSNTLYSDYLEVPILARVVAPFFEKIEPYGYIGPAIGIRLGALGIFDDGRRIDITDRVELLDVGLLSGAGIGMKVGNYGAFTFDLRYNFGLRNWSKIAEEDSEALNRAIYVTVGYRADLATLGRLFGGSR